MEMTADDFLGGRLRLRQPKVGYRAGIDPVLLAAACDVAQGARVLELGCGVGTALFCLARRVPGLALTGVERDSGLAALARENAVSNGLAAEIVTADLVEFPRDLRQRQFDLVLANPPFFDRRTSSPSTGDTREAGRGVQTPLGAWIATAARRLAPKGRLVMIHRIAHLPEMLRACPDTLGSIEIVPLQPRISRAPRLFILRAQKGGGAAFRLTLPVILHAGDAHVADGDDYRPEISAVLREAAALPIPGAC